MPAATAGTCSIPINGTRRIRSLSRSAAGSADVTGVLSVWHVSLQDPAQRFIQRVIPIGIDNQGKRSKSIEVLLTTFANLAPGPEPVLTNATRIELASIVIPDMLRRDLAHKGLLSESVTISWRLLAWIELN